MGAMFSFLAVAALVLISTVLVDQVNLRLLFGVYIPLAAVLIFFLGVVGRILQWAKVPVPFRIPTTCGQEYTFDWIKQNKIDNPSTTWGVILRMAAEVLLFRSLFRNTSLNYDPEGPRVRYNEEKWLWLFAIVFHYAFLTVLLRHLRFFAEPVPFLVHAIEGLDGFLEFGLPVVMLSGLVLGGAATMLFLRRLVLPQVRYISLAADYFPLLLILAIAATGILMRYFWKVDIVSVKELTLGLAAFELSPKPELLAKVGVIFYVHVFLVSVLFAYFPFSKLMHLGGVFLSPTRNLANNSRMKRHVNPWNYPVKVHSYQAYEDEFRDLMVEAGIPVEKQPQAEEEAPAEQEKKEAPAEQEEKE